VLVPIRSGGPRNCASAAAPFPVRADGATVGGGTCVPTEAGIPPLHGTSSGPGLIAVEFLADRMYPLACQITAACPSTRLPDVEPPPAERGNANPMESERQPVSAVGVDLAGTMAYPAPESGPDNGVSGPVAVTSDPRP